MTLLPKYWTVQRAADESGVSKYMANKAHALKKEQGTLAEPAKNLGKTF
jgi:hypothetical protein